MIILTQPQFDHINALNGIFMTYSVSRCIFTPATADSTVYRQLMHTIQEKELVQNAVYYPQQIDISPEIYLQVIHPSPNLLQCTANGSDCNGLVLRLVYKQVSFLFTADIDSLTEDYLIHQRANLKCTVLKVAHHGSKNSSTSEFLAISDPYAAVISAGKDNSYGHPHPETLARIYQHISPEYVFNTADNGTVEFITDGTGLWVKMDR